MISSLDGLTLTWSDINEVMIDDDDGYDNDDEDGGSNDGGGYDDDDDENGSSYDDDDDDGMAAHQIFESLENLSGVVGDGQLVVLQRSPLLPQQGWQTSWPW